MQAVRLFHVHNHIDSKAHKLRHLSKFRRHENAAVWQAQSHLRMERQRKVHALDGVRNTAARTPLSQTRFPNAEIEIDLAEGDPITGATVSNCTLNIHTFNQAFIKKNIDWDKSVKGILLVAKEKIEEKALDALRKELEQVTTQEQQHVKKAGELDAAISKFLTDSAKRTKTSLQVIDVSDNRYFNYNKTKLEDFLGSHASAVKDVASILSTKDLAAQTQAARPEHRPNIGYRSIRCSSKALPRLMND